MALLLSPPFFIIRLYRKFLVVWAVERRMLIVSVVMIIFRPTLWKRTSVRELDKRWRSVPSVESTSPPFLSGYTIDTDTSIPTHPSTSSTGRLPPRSHPHPPSHNTQYNQARPPNLRIHPTSILESNRERRARVGEIVRVFRDSSFRRHHGLVQ